MLDSLSSITCPFWSTGNVWNSRNILKLCVLLILLYIMDFSQDTHFLFFNSKSVKNASFSPSICLTQHHSGQFAACLLILDISVTHPRKWNLSWGPASIRVFCGLPSGGIFLIANGWKMAESSEFCHSSAVVSGLPWEASWADAGSKPLNGIVPWSLLQFLPRPLP